MKKQLKRAFRLINEYFDSFPSFLLALIIWLVFVGFLYEYVKLGNKDGFDFLWQLIGFTFVLAALTLSVNQKREVIPQQSLIFPMVGYLFILSGVGMILGIGLLMIGVLKNNEIVFTIIKWAGVIVFFASIFLLSMGISFMASGAWERLTSLNKKKIK